MSAYQAAKPPVIQQTAAPPRAASDCLSTSRTHHHAGKLFHWFFLAGALLILGAAFSLSIRSRQQVILPIVNQPLPGVCTFRSLTGEKCPGCGLTRSFIALAHGHFLESVRFNPAGILFFSLVVFQVPYRIYQLRRIRARLGEHRFLYADRWAVVVLAIALLGQWLIALAHKFA